MRNLFGTFEIQAAGVTLSEISKIINIPKKVMVLKFAG